MRADIQFPSRTYLCFTVLADARGVSSQKREPCLTNNVSIGREIYCKIYNCMSTVDTKATEFVWLKKSFLKK